MENFNFTQNQQVSKTINLLIMRVANETSTFIRLTKFGSERMRRERKTAKESDREKDVVFVVFVVVIEIRDCLPSNDG